MRFGLLISLFLATIAATDASKQQPDFIVEPNAFPTLVNPACSHCVAEAKQRADLAPDDRVLCWIRGYSDGGAIPFRFFMNKYPVISDTYGVFVCDPAAGFARGFAPSLEFSFHGWRNGVMVMRHKDGTLYSCLSGRAFAGPKKGSRLQPVPTLVSDWGFWLKHYPNAVAYKMFDKYQPTALPTAFLKASAKSRGPTDPRLPAEAEVLGVVVDEQTRAYPLHLLAKKGLLHDQLDGKPCVLLWSAATRTAAAYQPVASPPKDKSPARNLTLQRDDKEAAAPFTDQETGSRWDIAGRAVSGPLKGWTLAWLDSTQVRWHAWAAEYPQTSIYGK